MRHYQTGRGCAVACTVALLACGGATRPRPDGVSSATPVVTTASTTGAAPPVTSVAPVREGGIPSPARALPKLERVLDREIAKNEGPDAISFSFLELADGLFVVVNMPPSAFVVRGNKVEPLPHFFDGLRSPDPTDPKYLVVSALRGTLQDLRFDIVAPSTEYGDEVFGRPGHWKTRSGRTVGAKATQPSWVDERTILPPVTLRSGARIYEEANVVPADAKHGYSFRFDGPSKGAKLPVPLPGEKGCRYALRGHSDLVETAEGDLLGLGILCHSGEDPLTTAKLFGVGPPYQSLGARLDMGDMAIERWRGGKSEILPLPGGRAAEFAYFETVVVGASPTAAPVYVVAQVAGAKGSEGYVAELSGDRFVNVTPPDPPEHLLPFLTAANELYVFHPAKSFRRRGNAWEPILLSRGTNCSDWVSEAVELPNGDLLVSDGVGCLWSLKKGATTADLMPLEDGLFVSKFVQSHDNVYVVLNASGAPALFRVVPP